MDCYEGLNQMRRDMKSSASKASSSSSNSMRSSNSSHEKINSSTSTPSQDIVGESTPPQLPMVATQQTPLTHGGSTNLYDSTPKQGGSSSSDQVSKEDTLLDKLDSLKSHSRSTIWEHFDRVIEGGRVKGVCKYCNKSYMADTDKNGTTSIKNHLARCRSYGPNKEIFAANRQKILPLPAQKISWKLLVFLKWKLLRLVLR